MTKRAERTARAMTAAPLIALAALALLCVLAQPRAAAAQQPWSTPDASGNISNSNTGNVWVGTGASAPQGRLGVVGGTSGLAMSLFSPGAGAGETVPLMLFNAPGNSGGAAWNVARVRAGTNGVDSSASFFSIDPINANGAGWAAGLTIRAGGNVGVGTGAPGYRLHVAGDNTQAGGYPLIKLQNTQAGGHSFWLYAGATGSPGAFGLYDETAGLYRLFVDQAGNVGVGTAGPGYKLDVQGGQINAQGGLCIAGVCKSDWSQVGGSTSQWTSSPGGALSYSAGGVGIGTATPQNALTLARGGSAPYDSRPASELLQLVDKTDNTPQILFGTAFNGMQLRYTGTDTTAANQRLGVVTGAAGEAFVINNNGQVGIGTTTPGSGIASPDPDLKLHVQGSVYVNGNIAAKFQDVAEWVPSSKLLPAGTVVVLDASRSNQVTSSSKAYDTRVAGVVSPQPGISLGEKGEGKALVATTGRVRVKVDATRAPIQVGDLLVTSDVEGVAMKSVPVDLGGVRIHRPGTIIGKALEPLEKGTGEILVLLSLQ